MTQDDGTPAPEPNRAADVRAMTSNANWEARLEEARRKREEVLAAKGKPRETPPPLGADLKIHQIDGPAAELIDEAALSGNASAALPGDQPKPRLAALVPGATPPAEPVPPAPSAAEVLEFNRPGQPATRPEPSPEAEPLRLPRSAEVRDPAPPIAAPLAGPAASEAPATPAPPIAPSPEPAAAPPTEPAKAPPPLSARPETLVPPPPIPRVGPARAQDAMTGPDGTRLHLEYAARHDRRRRNRRLAFVLGAAFGAGMGVALAFMPPGTLDTLAARLGDLVQSAAAFIPTGV